MFDLPLSWNSILISSVNPRKVIYGYQCDFNNKEYSICITDFKNVWLEILSKQEIIEKANGYGIEDTEDENLQYLLETLINGFECGNASKIFAFSFPKVNKRETDPESKILIKFQKDVEWDFSAVKQPPSIAIDIISQINFQQFENHNYHNYKIEELERLIGIKDHYIVYLTENYKAINGDELIKKYRKNNKTDSKYLHKYDKEFWTRKMESSYIGKIDRTQNTNKNCYDKLWEDIEKSISDKKSWVFSKTFATNYTPKPIHVKHESDQSLSQMSKDKSKATKEDDIISPRKRVKKIGIIGSRKRKMRN